MAERDPVVRFVDAVVLVLLALIFLTQSNSSLPDAVLTMAFLFSLIVLGISSLIIVYKSVHAVWWVSEWFQ